MKTLKQLFSAVVLCGLMTATLRSQPPAVIKIDLDRKIAPIDPNIYGAFVEPIRTVVYGSIYDPKSSFSDENGFRKDFVQLLKDSETSEIFASRLTTRHKPGGGITGAKARFGHWRLAARTGCTWAVRKLVPRSRRSHPLWKPAGAWISISETTSRMFFPSSASGQPAAWGS
jgi:hypothetical protein